ncbi:MAG: hypothetical protein IPN69_18140 [Acidobacteria bacterium]|nr:hypothetical protein [Acidobacteriota bacterium]
MLIRTILSRQHCQATACEEVLRDEPGIEIVGECGNLALKRSNSIDSVRPDLVFLDIQMPEKPGFPKSSNHLAIATFRRSFFVTAYDHYALEAFASTLLDYLLKTVQPRTPAPGTRPCQDRHRKPFERQDRRTIASLIADLKAEKEIS